jgi:hypothetical protein
MRQIYGYEHIIPTHQGRAAEHILSRIAIRPGQLVPGNMYFTTTKLHQELAGGVFVDVIVDEAHDPASRHPWKGNIDLIKLMGVVERHGVDQIAYVSFEHSVNMAGGQPVGMENMKEVYAYCSTARIQVFFDATRAVENAYLIQKRDSRYHRTHVRDILREMMLYGDGCTVSGKKDYLVNIGGLLGALHAALAGEAGGVGGLAGLADLRYGSGLSDEVPPMTAGARLKEQDSGPLARHQRRPRHARICLVRLDSPGGRRCVPWRLDSGSSTEDGSLELDPGRDRRHESSHEIHALV